MKDSNVIVEKTFEFAVGIVEFSKKLREKKEFDLSSQIFRSGTSIGANVHEAQNAESRADFIHKMKIAAKECEEIIFWLQLCERSNHLIDNQKLTKEAREIKKILNAIIGTSKRMSR